MDRGVSRYGAVIEGFYGVEDVGRMIYIRPSSPKIRALDVTMIYHGLARKYDELNIMYGWRPIEDRVNIILGLEGTDYLDEPWDIQLFHMLGVRVLGLTWNYDTRFAASCMSKKDYGLTGFGAELIDLCEELGIVIDLAHSSKQTMIDTLSISSKEVVISHSNYYSIKPHVRNVDDDVLDMLSQNGGVLGFTYIREAIGGEEPRDLSRHIDMVMDRYGREIVALGTDLFGCNPPEKLRRIEGVKEVYRELLGIGWTEDMIISLSYKNAERVFRSVLKG